MTTSTTTTPTPGAGTWNEHKSRLKTTFPTLTDSDLNYEESNRDVMFNRLQVKLGKTRAELESVCSQV